MIDVVIMMTSSLTILTAKVMRLPWAQNLMWQPATYAPFFLCLLNGKQGSDQAITLIIRHLTQNKTCFQCLDIPFQGRNERCKHVGWGDEGSPTNTVSPLLNPLQFLLTPHSPLTPFTNTRPALPSLRGAQRRGSPGFG